MGSEDPVIWRRVSTDATQRGQRGDSPLRGPSHGRAPSISTFELGSLVQTRSFRGCPSEPALTACQHFGPTRWPSSISSSSTAKNTTAATLPR